ncbi:Ig-like domain-containing protein [Myxococcus sp. CA040A]|uniref:Ig-like domain-containing protein n=1 Tax=Myxococcus sp. CA040A TaxID=2741738 RepID=UPI00157ACFCB|nr:Ig-like domain-containing protein [Myxococcus sp. CA040A]NTX01076.1 M4 family metallopeptidase [Myxococcus sp. CA040A]
MQRFLRVLAGAVLLVSCGESASESVKTPVRLEVERELTARGFDLREMSVVPRKEGDDTYHQLRVDELPVWGVGAKTANGKTRVTPVRVEPTAKVETQARVTRGEAEAAALSALGDPTGTVLRGGELMLRPHEERRLKPGVPVAGSHDATQYERVITELTPIYRLTLSTGGPGSLWAFPREWVGEVDALSGKVLRVAPAEVHVTYANASLKGRYSGTNTFSVVVNTAKALYKLEDKRGNKFLATRPNGDGTITYLDYSSPDASFGDGALFNVTSEARSTNGETAAVDAFFASNMTSTMFEYFLGRTGSKALPPMEFKMHYPWDNAGYIASSNDPRVLIGYETYPAPTGVTTLVHLAATDIVAHEITHDFFMREVWGDPSLGSGASGEIAALNEGTGDIMGSFTELGRDTLKRRPLNEIDQVLLRPANLTIGEDTGVAGRSLLTPSNPEWTPDLVNWDEHESCGPIDRMFLLLAYGCQPLAQGQSPGPWNCPRVPEGFTGIGPSTAAVIWTRTVEALPVGADYAQARDAALMAAGVIDGASSSTKMRAVASAFAAINVGAVPDNQPPQATLSCRQRGSDIECTGTITDAETPNQARQAPRLVVDGGVQTVVLPSFQFTQLIPAGALSTGPHTIVLEAWDLWNNQVTKSVTVTLDRTPPTASLTVTGSLKQPWFLITANDASGIDSVDFIRNGQLIVSLMAPPFDHQFDTTTWADGTYPLTINVSDPAGNVTTLTHTLRVDNTPPSVSMAVSSAGPPFTVNASVSDASVITRVDFKVDGVVFATRTNSATTYSASYSPTDGLAHNLIVEVTDAFGNKGVATRAAPLDSTPPAVTFSASQLGTTMTLSANVTDTCGIQYPYSLFVDGTLVAQPTTSGYVLTFGSEMASGTHVFQALAQDRCGNTANFVASFVKSNSVPVIVSITRNDTQPKKPKFTVACNDPEGVHHVEMRENGVILQSDTTAPYEFVVDTSSRTDGDYIVLFQCSDNAGFASSPETRTVIADNTGPTFNFSVQGSRRAYLVSAGAVSDSHGVQSVTLSGGLIGGFTVTLPVAPYAYVWNIAGTAPVQSDIPFSISARDTWGNESSLSRICYVDTASTQDVVLNCH